MELISVQENDSDNLPSSIRIDAAVQFETQQPELESASANTLIAFSSSVLCDLIVKISGVFFFIFIFSSKPLR